MDAACQRLCEGDTSSLLDIINCVEARKSHEVHRLGTRTLTAIINILIQEGVELRRTRDQESNLPSSTAFFAARLLAQLGMRQTEDGVEVQRALLVLGLQRCRDLCLDAYFGLNRAQRYYVVMFVKLLTVLYGCTPQDLLHNETSINLLTGSLQIGGSLSSPNGTAGGAEVAARALPDQNTRSVSDNSNGGGLSARGSNLRSTPRSAPSPLPRETTANASRASNIQNRSALLVSIPGASLDMPLRATRRYRDLPKKATNAPFAVNPLYEGPSAPTGGSGGASNGGASLLSRPDTPVPLSPEPAPLARSTAPEITIPAQFPTPVVLFTSYYGLGCVPRLPTADDLVRLDVWRQEKQQHPPPPRDMQKSVIKTCKGSAEDGDVGREFGKVRLVALCSNPTGPASAAPLENFEVRNQHTFAPSNTATAPYQQECLNSPLLHQYMEQGKLISWGSAAKGALGPQRQRRSQSAFSEANNIPVKPVPRSSSSDKEPSPRGGYPCYSKRNHSSNENNRSSPLSTTIGKAVTPLTSTLGATRDAQGGLDGSNGPVSGNVKNSLHCTASSSLGCTDYVYLPTSVNTPARVASVACGLSVTYLVTVDGVLYSCGRGENGQLGIGERALRYVDSGTCRLQRVLLRDAELVTRVAAGTACAVALAADRALYCWGHNVYGQCLKFPDLCRVLTPVRLKTTVYKVLDICFGQFFGVLLFDNGIMGTWGIASMLGCNVGDKELEESLAPDQCKCARQVVHLELESGCPVAAVRAGPWHALAISKQGEVYTWGVGRGGRLGHGTDGPEVKPRLVEGLRSCFVVDASCASGHTAVLTSAGSVFVFGDNAEGQLGLRSKSPRRLPTALQLPGKAVAVACAREHTCVLLEDGDVVACGSYRTCGIGLGYGTRLCAPVRILTNYVSLVLQCGYSHSLACVLHRRTALMMVGHSTINEVSRILSVVVRTGVRCAASGVGFLVVLSENNSLVSIGRGERGQLGIGDCMKPASSEDVTVTPKFMPVQLPRDVVIQHLRCGPDYVVALDQDGAVYGWGSNEFQKLSQPRQVDYVYTPVRLSSYKEHRVIQVACGGTFMIALVSDGSVLAHGEATYCGLGSNSGPSGAKRTDTIGTPTPIPSLHDIVAIAAGRRHAIAMTSSCNIFAWGVGVLGCGAAAVHGESFSPAAFTPVRVALSQNIRTIGCGIHNSFAITEEGELWVWGVNCYGECGVPPNREGGMVPAATASPRPQQQQQQAGTATSAIDVARIIQTPIAVARQVRDAAFTSQFGLVIFEDGQVCVSGRVRHGGHKYILPSFHSNPQPPFSVDVNGPAQRRWPEGDASLSSGLSRAEAALPTLAPVAAAPGTTVAATSTEESIELTPRNMQEVISLGEGDDKDEEGDDASSMESSVGSGLVRLPTDPSTGTQLPSPTVEATDPVLLEKRGTSATVAETRHAQRESAHDAFEPPNLLSCGSGGQAKAVRASGSSVLVADLPTLATKASPRLPPVRPFAGPLRKDDASVAATVKSSPTGGAVRNLVSPPPLSQPQRLSHGLSAASIANDDGSSPSRLSLSPGAGMFRSETYAASAREMTEASAAGLGTPTSDLDGTADLFDQSAARSRAISTSLTRNFPEVDDSSPLQPPLLTAIANEAHQELLNGKEVIASETGLSQQSPSPPSMPRPPQSFPTPNGTSRPTSDTMQAALKKRKPKSGSSLPVPAVVAVPAATGEATRVSRKTRRAVLSTPNVQSTSPPAAVKADQIFGLRCFAGWEQICTVIEKHRPSAKEVRMAHDGLQVIQH